MPWSIFSVVGLAMISACIPPVIGQEPQAKPKAKVELRWVETKRVEGLTEEKGFQSSCDPDSIVYMHKKPALVLTAAEVTEVRVTNLDLSKNGLSRENYTVTLYVTKEARDKLAASCGDKDERLLTVVVDGKANGVGRYVKGRAARGAPAQVSAETFLPSVGFFPSKAEAERIVDAFKTPDSATNSDSPSKSD
ncbi:MAG: hypothetical protein JWM11_5512 [Planctomycetaceae bacterium]|nr:hypothetical protein [Planctomycetaceae bacterium]